MKASESQIRGALDKPGGDVRLYLLYGPDEAGAMALADRLARAMGPEAERTDLDGATLKADPARLVDEAASLSLFGSARHVRVTAAGDESLAAVQALLEAERVGNPVVMIAPSVKATNAIAKAALASPAALAYVCYLPTGREAQTIASTLAREQGLRTVGETARRIAQASAGDRAVMAREIEKLALYLDAAPERPQTLDDAALDAVGADLGDSGFGAAIEAIVAGRAADLAGELARLAEAGVSPIPWLRGLARKLASLAEMRAEIDAGDSPANVVKRHRVFWREESATLQALGQWNPAMLAGAHAHMRAAERAIMGSGTAGEVLADHAALEIARRAGRR